MPHYLTVISAFLFLPDLQLCILTVIIWCDQHHMTVDALPLKKRKGDKIVMMGSWQRAGEQTSIKPSAGHIGRVLEFPIKSFSKDHHGLPNICCHIALNNLFVDPTECMYSSSLLSWAHLKACACVCILVSVENKVPQSTAATTTKWSAGLRNRYMMEIEPNGIVHTSTHTQIHRNTHTGTNSTYSNSGRPYFCSSLHPGCLTQLKHRALFQLQHGR